MVMIDTSAWIEYFRNSRKQVVRDVDYCLANDRAAIGDLVYCEVLQGIRLVKERTSVASLFHSLPRFDMVGFDIADKAADNYRLLRTKGITVRKTVDVLIGTFCAEHGMPLIHADRDFTGMSHHIGLEVYRR